ncbi:unnamed protein product, partial [Meganyctiphanes norvegica]
VLYSGNLLAMITVPSFEKTVNSLTDIVDAVEKDGFTLNLVGDSSYELYLKEADSVITKNLYNLLSKNLPENNDEGFDNVLKFKYIYIDSLSKSTVHIAKRGSNKFHISRESFSPQPLGIVLYKEAPFKDLFNRYLLYMNEAGLIDKWIRDVMDKAAIASQEHNNHENYGPLPIALSQIWAAFFLLLLGNTVAFVVLLLECCWGTNSRKHSAKETNEAKEDDNKMAGDAN